MLLPATVTKKKSTVYQADKQLGLHDDKYRYDEREINGTKKLT